MDAKEVLTAKSVEVLGDIAQRAGGGPGAISDMRATPLFGMVMEMLKSLPAAALTAGISEAPVTL